MKAFLLPLFTWALVGATAAPAVGDWVCPDSATHHALESCPALVVADGDSVEVLGAMGLRKVLPASAVTPVGRASSAKVLGATESIHMSDNYAMAIRLGGMGNYLRQAGLILQAGKRVDTVEFYESAERLGKAPGSCPDSASWEACLDAYPGYGLLHQPLLPAWPTARPSLSRWSLSERDGYSPARSKAPGAFGPIHLFYQEHPKAAGQPRFFETETGAWVLSAGSKYFALDLVADTAARISESQIDFTVRQVSFFKRPKSDAVLAVVETGGSYSDGNFEDLFVISMLPGRDTVFARCIPFSGSNGEASGSTAEGAWWMAAEPGNRQRLYVASAQAGNENGESADLGLSAFDIAATGSIQPVKASAFSVVTFGTPAEWDIADSLASALMAGRPQARKAGLKALPLLSGGKMAWVAGAPAPDRATAKAWAAWAKGGKVRNVKASKRK